MHVSALRHPSNALIAVVLLVIVLVMFPAGKASAHDELISTDPAADSTVDALPEQVSLTFSVELIGGEGSTAVEVTNASGRDVGDGEVELDGALVTQRIDTAGAQAGAYLVKWKVVSSDGHPIAGEYTFTVTTGSDSTPSAEPSPEPSAAPSAAAGDEPSSEPTAVQPSSSDRGGVPGSAWIWVIVIAAVLAFGVFAVWLGVRRRTGGTPASNAEPAADSEPDAEG